MYVQVIDCRICRIPNMSGENPNGYLVRQKKRSYTECRSTIEKSAMRPPKVHARSFDITSTFVESIAMTTQMGPCVNTYTELTLCGCNYKSPITIAILSYTIPMVVERTEI